MKNSRVRPQYFCPTCGSAALFSDGGIFCFRCQDFTQSEPTHFSVVDEMVKRGQLKGAGSGGCEYATESQLVNAIVQALQKRGLRALRVGQHVVKGSGSDAGVPDLIVWHPHFGRGCGRLLEVKLPTGKASAEQAQLAESGMIIIVRSVQDALHAVGEQS